MAIVENHLIGRTTKSVNGLTFQRWKNKQVVRTRPYPNQLNVSNVQLEHRAFMSKFMKMSSKLRPVYEIGLKFIKHKSFVFNTFNSINYDSAFQMYNPDFNFRLDNIQFSKGTYKQVYVLPAALPEPHKFRIQFVNNEPGALGNNNFVLRVFFIDAIDYSFLSGQMPYFTTSNTLYIDYITSPLHRKVAIVAFLYNQKEKNVSTSFAVLLYDVA